MRKVICLLMVLMLAGVGFSSTAKILIIFDIHARATGTGSSPIPTDDPDGLLNPLTGYRLTGYDNYSVPLAVARANSESVDLVLADGDNINGTTGGTRAEQLARLATDFTGLTSDLYMNVGHWDIGTDATDNTTYQAFYGDANYTALQGDNMDKLWWPSAIDDDTPVAYIVDETIDGQVWRIISVPYNEVNGNIDFTTAGEWDNDGGGAANIALGDWFDDVALQGAEDNGYPCIIMMHERLVNTVENIPDWTWTVDPTESALQAIADMENQTIPPVVLQGHIHCATGYKVVNNVLYIDGRADLWSETTPNNTRFSHGILTLSYPAYRIGGKTLVQVKLDGYGEQVSLRWIDPPVSYLRCEDSSGYTDANSIRDALGSYHLDPSEAVVSTNAFMDSSNVYYVNRALSCNGTFYADDQVQSPIGSAPPLSVSMWIQTTSTTESTLISFGKQGQGLRWLGVGINEQAGSGYTGYVNMLTRGAIAENVQPIVETKVINDGQWHHLVAVWADVDDRTLYVDGAYKVQNSTPTAMPSLDILNRWRLCQHIDGSGNVYTGNIDEVMVYSGALTSSEVWALYIQGKSKFTINNSSRGLNRF